VASPLPPPEVGQRVHVDLSGMQTNTGPLPEGTLAPGLVTHKAADGTLTIRLDFPVGGYPLVTAPAARIRSII
jgi:hypothetical protein